MSKPAMFDEASLSKFLSDKLLGDEDIHSDSMSDWKSQFLYEPETIVDRIRLMHRNQLYHTAAGFLGKLATFLNAWALEENPIPIPQWYIIVRCKFYAVLVDLVSQIARRHDTVKWNVDNVSNIDACSSRMTAQISRRFLKM